MGLAARAGGDPFAARGDFERALAENPPAPGAAKELAGISLAEGRTADARLLLERYLREAGPDPETLATLAVVQANAGEGDAAVRTIREASSALVVLRALNVEFRIWEQLARNARNPVRRAALHVVARSLRRYELAQLNACDAVVPITADDGRDFRALGCERPMHVLPGGVQPLDLAEGPDPRAIYFLGSLDYRPNQEAALWIARELLPRLARRAPEATLHLGGSNGPRRLREQLVAAGVSVIDDVPDAAAFARPMGIMIAPLFAGGGMRIKILEAMALGKPVVSTSLGAAGIDVTQGSNILLADDAETFGDAVAALVRDPLRARQLGAAGRRLVEERYDATALTRELLAFLEELLQSREIDRRHRA